MGVPGEVQPARAFFWSIPGSPEGVPGVFQGVLSPFLVLQTPSYTSAQTLPKNLFALKRTDPRFLSGEISEIC